MTLNDVINKSLYIKDNMNGFLTIRLKNKRPYYSKQRNTYSKDRSVKLYVCHCESCGKEDFRYYPGVDRIPNIILCRKKKCKLEYARRDIKPIKYNGKLYKIEDCPKSYFRTYHNPVKAWISAIKRNAKRSKECQTPEHKAKILKRHPVWSYAYYVKSNPDILIDYNIPWEERQKQFYKDNPKCYKQMREFRSNEVKVWIENNTERHQKNEKAKRKRLKEKYPERYLLGTIINGCLKYTGIRRNKMGFDTIGIFNHLLKDAKSLGYPDIKAIKSTKKYHVDHIIPRSLYDLTIPGEMLKCNHPLNLRWLPAKENIIKGNRIRPEDIKIIEKIPKKLWPKGFDLENYK